MTKENKDYKRKPKQWFNVQEVQNGYVVETYLESTFIMDDKKTLIEFLERTIPDDNN